MTYELGLIPKPHMPKWRGAGDRVGESLKKVRKNIKVFLSAPTDGVDTDSFRPLTTPANYPLGYLYTEGGSTTLFWVDKNISHVQIEYNNYKNLFLVNKFLSTSNQ